MTWYLTKYYLNQCGRTCLTYRYNNNNAVIVIYNRLNSYDFELKAYRKFKKITVSERSQKGNTIKARKMIHC